MCIRDRLYPKDLQKRALIDQRLHYSNDVFYICRRLVVSKIKLIKYFFIFSIMKLVHVFQSLFLLRFYIVLGYDDTYDHVIRMNNIYSLETMFRINQNYPCRNLKNSSQSQHTQYIRVAYYRIRLIIKG